MPLDDTTLREVPLSDEAVFRGIIIDVSHMQVRLPNGKTAMREIVHHNGGVVIVPVDAHGNVTLVRQYRAPLGEILLEAPAGKRDSAQEDPLEGAMRELEEECGLRAAHWQKLTSMIPTPGYCTERLHIFLATGLTQCAPHLDADEFLSVSQMPLAEAVSLVESGDITDGKTALGLLLAERALQKQAAPLDIRYP